MNDSLLYSDSLIEIRDRSLKLNNYYFPSMASKIVPFSHIDKIEIKIPFLFNGKWRLQGTGDFKTWYSMDLLRPKRDKLFLIVYKNKWMQSGFTVEDSVKAESIFRMKGLLQ